MISLSVIIATFNSEKTLRRTLDSLLGQQFVNFECLVIDGNSNDKTIRIVEDYESKFTAKDIAFKYISEPDNGIYDAWNKGLKMAKGEWISFLGSDDIYLANALISYQGVIDTFSEDNMPHLLYSDVDYVKGDVKIMTINGVWSWKKFQRFMCIAHVGSFHNRKYFNEFGNFDATYKICGDYELLLRAKEKLKTFKIEKTTVHMEAGGVSNNLVDKAFKETYKAKTTSGGLSKGVAKIDYYIAHAKHWIKTVLSSQ